MLYRLLIAGVALLSPALSLSQGYCDPRADAACYQRWCSSQGGKPVYRGNWGCDMSGARSGYSGGGGGQGAELGRQIGGALGLLIREGLFGNPQQDALRRAEMEAQRNIQEQERQRIAAEQARQEEDRYRRLSASLLDFSPGPRLSLMTDSKPAGGLQLMLGEEAERSISSPALAELTRAAAWSTLAARASTPEDAAVLADAAFQSLIGGKVNLPPPPPDVKGVPVHPFFTEVDPLKKQYLELRTQLPNAIGPVVDAEQRRATFLRLERESLEMERTAKEVAKRAQARDAARQARELREKAEAELRSARADFQRQQYKANDVEQGLRALLSSMAAPPRKPDSYFYLGFEDGSQCFSQNSGPRCDKARAPAAEFDQCLANYRLGYTAGEKVRKEMLDRAHQWGGRDGSTGIYAITDTRAEGPCRYDYVVSYNRGYFSERIGLLASAPSSTKADVPPPRTSRGPRNDAERLREGVISYAQRLGWTDKEQARLREAIAAVPFGESEGGSYVPAKIYSSWEQIEKRFKTGDFAAIAAKGEGPNLYGAGLQGYNDCVIYAVAAASGRPYGFVAAQANKMIREGGWRAETDPKKVFGPGGGLHAEEVVMLAEGFGQARVVKPGDFANTLKSRHPVLVNVVPQSMNTSNAHQIVLAKTFQYRGETWYEAIDSNFGPLRRLYMSHSELDALLHDNGIAYMPEPGTTVKFLRNPAASR